MSTILHRTPEVLEVKVVVLWFEMKDPYYTGDKNIKIQNEEQNHIKKECTISKVKTHSFFENKYNKQISFNLDA